MTRQSATVRTFTPSHANVPSLGSARAVPAASRSPEQPAEILSLWLTPHKNGRHNNTLPILSTVSTFPNQGTVCAVPCVTRTRARTARLRQTRMTGSSPSATITRLGTAA